jgi:hypothetical protein
MFPETPGAANPARLAGSRLGIVTDQPGARTRDDSRQLDFGVVVPVPREDPLLPSICGNGLANFESAADPGLAVEDAVTN